MDYDFTYSITNEKELQELEEKNKDVRQDSEIKEKYEEFTPYYKAIYSMKGNSYLHDKGFYHNAKYTYLELEECLLEMSKDVSKYIKDSYIIDELCQAIQIYGNILSKMDEKDIAYIAFK